MKSSFNVLLCLQLLFLLPTICNCDQLRVMTFNIWLSGVEVDDGLKKIAKHILLVDPDIVALQEVETHSIVGNLTDLLGGDWVGISHSTEENVTYPDTAILTKHTIHLHSYAETNWTMGVKISLDSGQFLYFWAAHLQYKSYGPYAAYNKMVSSHQQIMAGEKPSTGNGRWHNMMEVKQNKKLQRWLEKSNRIPTIFAGDFNSPSHLDWTHDRKFEHGGWSVKWPATEIIADMGFIDSFRELHPDSEQNPGTSWSTVNKFNPEWDYTIPEPQDRVDFIFYRGQLAPLRSYTYAGTEVLRPIPYHQQNDYPSDHFAVITEFEII